MSICNFFQIPEAAEMFFVSITEVQGGGRLGTNVVATLNINKNDDAIFFEGNLTINVF